MEKYKIAIFVSLTTIIAVVVLPFLLGLAIRAVPDFPQPSLDFTEKVYEGSSLSQPFTASRNSLNLIGVSVKNPQLRNKEDLILTIYDSMGVPVRIARVSGESIPDGDFIKFNFDPIFNSAGHQFILNFSSPATTLDKTYELFITNTTPSGMGPLQVNREMKDEAISLVGFYKPESKLAVSAGIYRGWLKRLLADPVFFIFYSLLFVAGIFYVTWPHAGKTN